MLTAKFLWIVITVCANRKESFDLIEKGEICFQFSVCIFK